jgi:hypothetical protein
MSWDDVVIGKRPKGAKICSATRLLVDWDSNSDKSYYLDDKIKIDISHNRESFWISDIFDKHEGMGMTIYKDTKEGKELQELINSLQYKKIDSFIEMTFLKNIAPYKLRNMIIHMKKVQYDRGMDKARKDMRIVLGFKS